jgi:hypothetical protein
MVAFRVVAWCSLAFTVQQSRAAPGKIHLVVGSDTAIWNAGTTVDVFTRHPHYRQDSFTDTNAPIFQAMSPGWRNLFKDSFGQSIKFTWWMMGGNIYRDADNLNVPVANTMTLHLMKQYHGEAIQQFGDELSLHYHTFLWSDYNGSGVFFWNQTRTFEECRADFDVTLAQYFLEEGVFPVSFRSGWHFMDSDWQAYLNQLIPYCFHDNFPAKLPWYTNTGPIAGVEDWSHAVSAFVPFHPSVADYQIPGDTSGWDVRSVKLQALTQPIVDQLFADAAAGSDQVACFWTHLPENFIENVAKLGSFLAQSSLSHPTVEFRYCTAVEAMRRWRGLTNQVPPVLKLGESWQGANLTLSITSSAPVFQSKPFVCSRDVFQQYQNLTDLCVATGTNSWSISLPIATNLLAKVGIGMTDHAGNLATKILRFVPDDLYLDNKDPGYSEEQGAWISTTDSAWGTDARVASLASQSSAKAGWSLPLQGSGQYRISTQVPAIANAATNVLFDVMEDGTNLLSVLFPTGISTNQWVCIGAVELDQSVSNRVQFVVDGANQSGANAVADVLRVTPAPPITLSPSMFKGPLQIDSSPAGFVVRWAAAAGRAYSVQRSSSATGPWIILQTATLARSGILEFKEENAPALAAFYQILQP